MKKLVKLLTGVTLAMTLFGTTGIALAAEPTTGSTGALADDNYTLEEMLTYAIQDEYAAEAEYNEIIDTYGSVRPFTNIVKAEATHIQALVPLFESANLELPVNDAAAHVVLPDSLKSSYSIGVEAEILNIGMYESFLKEDLPEDVRTVFEALMRASEKHLTAFERAANRQSKR